MADRESNKRRSFEESSRPQLERQRRPTDRHSDSARYNSPPPRRRDSFYHYDKEQESLHGNPSRRHLEKADTRYRRGEESGKRRERDKSERDYDRRAPQYSQSPPPRRDRRPGEHASQNHSRRDNSRDRSPYRRRSRSPPRRRSPDRDRDRKGEDEDRPRRRRSPDNKSREYEPRIKPLEYSEHRRFPRRSEDQDRDKDKSRARDKDRERDRDKDRDKNQERPRQSRRSPSASRSPPRHRHHHRRRRSRSRSRSAEDKKSAPYKRSTAPLPSQDAALAIAQGAEPPVEKQKPNYGRSGKLAAETNTVQGTDVVLKYNEPPEARKPPASADWRLFVFKGADQLESVQLGERSCWLFGRERAIADFPVDHPSCSKQHAVIQFRYVEKRGEDGIGRKGGVKPYVIDLESANGTKVNGEKIPDRVYYELKSNDLLAFGDSTREYVVVLAPK